MTYEIVSFEPPSKVRSRPRVGRPARLAAPTPTPSPLRTACLAHPACAPVAVASSPAVFRRRNAPPPLLPPPGGAGGRVGDSDGAGQHRE